MQITRTTEPSRRILAVRENVPMASMTQFFSRAFGTAARGLGVAGAHPSGPPVSVYFGSPSSTADVAAGFPFEGEIAAASGTTVVDLPGGDAVTATHSGPYETLGVAYAAIAKHIEESGLHPAGPMWEEYLVGPDAAPDPAAWRTRVVFPVV